MFNDINSMWEDFKKSVTDIIETHVPTKMTLSRYSNPWMTTRIRRTIRRKQRAHSKARRTGKKRDSDRYRRLQQEVQWETRRANREYMEDISTNYQTNPKKFWSFIKSEGQESAGIASLKNKDGFMKSDIKSKANILNDQFHSVFTKEDTSRLPDKGASPYCDMHDIIVNANGVTKLLKGLKPHKATGPDTIPATILKAAAEELAPILTRIFQHSLDTGEVPQDWRDAWVVPIFKKGEKHKAENYRPVSLTSITCKILEHIIHSNVMALFDRHQILKDNQHGFRKRRSCETQLIVTINEIASSLSKGQQIDIILLDFAKAFDKVPHSRLIYKLNFYGVRNKTSRWIQAFLGGRKETVLLEGYKSDEADVISGVPQGTVLGPLLFLAYINDMPEMCSHSDTRLFADDSLLYKAIKTQQDAINLQEDLRALESWEKTWQMSFNASKCSVLRVRSSSRKRLIETPYQLHGITLETEDSSKYLGVTLTNNMTWTKHINNIVTKGNRTLGFLRRNFRDCTKPVKAATYTSIVRPALEYSAPVWDPYRQKDIKALEQVQRRAARYACNNYRDRSPGCVTGMIESLQLESLESRRRASRLSMLYKIQHGLVDIDKDRYLQQSDSRTRGGRFYQARSTTEVYDNSFFPRTIRDWNSLPPNAMDAENIKAFRAGLTRDQL